MPHSSEARMQDWLELLRTAEDLPYPIIDPYYGHTWRDRLNWNATERHTSNKPNMQMPQEQRKALQADAKQKLGHLRDSTVLLIGDSMERNTMWYTGQVMAAEDKLRRFNPLNVEEELSLPMQLNAASRALHRLDFDSLDFSIASCFMYGNAVRCGFAHACFADVRCRKADSSPSRENGQLQGTQKTALSRCATL